MSATALLPPAPLRSGDTQWKRVVRNGYEYRIDDEQRTRQVSGTLSLNPDQARSRASQGTAGGSDRLKTDDGAHYIARRFNGPRDAFNHFAQDASFNRGGYRVLEDIGAKAKKAGKSVSVKITPHYGGSSRRPDAIEVSYTVGDEFRIRSFPNMSRGKAHGRR